MAGGARTGKDEDVEPGWVPPEIDTTQANIARVYRKLGVHGRGRLTAFVIETLGTAPTGGSRPTP